jgi:hypothetical protein
MQGQPDCKQQDSQKQQQPTGQSQQPSTDYLTTVTAVKIAAASQFRLVLRRYILFLVPPGPPAK